MNNANRIAALTSAIFDTDTPTITQQTRVARVLAFMDGAIAQFDDPNASAGDKAKLGIDALISLMKANAHRLNQYDRNLELGAVPDASSEFK